MHAPFAGIVGTQQIRIENKEGNLPFSHSQVVYKRPGTFGGVYQTNQSFNATSSFIKKNIELSHPQSSTGAFSDNNRPFKKMTELMDRGPSFLDPYTKGN